MRRICWSLTRFLSQLVDGPERDAVLGDLEERGFDGTLRGLAEVLLLTGGQQLRLLAGWRPWVGGIALFPSLTVLVGCAFSIAEILARYPWLDLGPTTPFQAASIALSASIVTAIWTWISGFGLGWLARRSYPAALVLLALATFLLTDTIGPSRLILLAAPTGAGLIIVPLLTGLRRGLARRAVSPRSAMTLIVIAGMAHSRLLQPGFAFGATSLAINAMLSALFVWPLLLPMAQRLRTARAPYLESRQS